MDRQIVYPGSIPLDTDLLNVERSTMVALGYLAQATLGTNMVADGLACLPTSPASMSVTVGPGSITELGIVDATAFGSLPADTTDPLVKMGINLTATTLSCAAPTVSGQAINYLVEASLLESDATPVVLPYYNAANPAQSYSGPNNSGTAQNTQRLQRVQIALKPGAPGQAGSQATPPVDSGWVGLWVVTVAFGQTAITSANITLLPTAPFIGYKLPALTPGVRNLAVLGAGAVTSWTVPAGVTTLRLRLWGGGGAGGMGNNGVGGGGGGGGYNEGYYSVTPGASYPVTVGAGGIGSGGAGGTTSFGTLASATGGGPGGNGALNAAGTAASGFGQGYGSGLGIPGSLGQGALISGSTWVSGAGGGAFASPGGLGLVLASGSNANGNAGAGPGAGGAGGIGNGAGGQGGAGLILVEW